MTTNSVVDKIRKLLSLSKSNNVNEAASAAAMAQELMIAHEIEVADLEVTTGVRAEAEEIANEVLEDAGGRRKPWRLFLAQHLATAYGCDVYYYGPRTHVIGPVSGIQTVRYMQGYLALEIVRLCEAAWANEKALWVGTVPPVAVVWKRNFNDGAVDAIGRRLRLHRKEQEQKFTQTAAQAMVLVRRDEELTKQRVDKLMRDVLGPRGGHHASFGGQGDRGAYAAGQAAGQSVNLGGTARSLGGSKERLR